MRKTSMTYVALAILVGCVDDPAPPADPATARDLTTALLPSLLDDAAAEVSAAGETPAIAAASDTMSSLQDSYPDVLGAADKALKLIPKDGGESLGAAAARWLREHVLLEAAYEGDGVYLLLGSAVCPVPEDATAPDPRCAEVVDTAELRVRVTREGEGLDFTLLVGPARTEPLVLALRRNSLDVEVDLTQAREALLHVAAIADVELSLPAVMKGRVAFELARPARRNIDVTVAVRAAVQIAGDSARGPYQLDVAARDPLVRLSLDGATGHHALVVDLGPVGLRAPWTLLASTSRATGTLVIDWRGLTGHVALGDDRALHLTGLGLGDGTSTVKLDGHTLLGVSVNGGGTFALTIVPRAGSLPRLLVDPGLDLAVTLGLAPLAAAGDDVAAWARDEVLTVHVGQELQPLEGALQVVRGTLRLAATRASASVTVNEGQCLHGSALEGGEHPLLGRFAAGTCR